MAEITKELGRIPVSRGNYQSTTEYYKDVLSASRI